MFTGGATVENADGAVLGVLAIIFLACSCACLLADNAGQEVKRFQRLDEEQSAGSVPEPPPSRRLQLLMDLTASSPREDDGPDAFPIEVAEVVARSWEPVKGRRPVKARVINSSRQQSRSSRQVDSTRSTRDRGAGTAAAEHITETRSPLRKDTDSRPDDLRYLEEQRARLEAALLVHVKLPVSPTITCVSSSPASPTAEMPGVGGDAPRYGVVDEAQPSSTCCPTPFSMHESYPRIVNTGPLSDDKWFSEDVADVAMAAPKPAPTRACAVPHSSEPSCPRKQTSSTATRQSDRQLASLSPKRPTTAQEAIDALALLEGMGPEQAMQTLDSIDDRALLALQYEAQEAIRLEAGESTPGLATRDAPIKELKKKTPATKKSTLEPNEPNSSTARGRVAPQPPKVQKPDHPKSRSPPKASSPRQAAREPKARHPSPRQSSPGRTEKRSASPSKSRAPSPRSKQVRA